MNVNNLENLKDELKELGFSKSVVTQMEEQMKKDNPEFQIKEEIPALKGQVELTLHFKQSSQSDYYYFNKFEATHQLTDTLNKGEQYMVIHPDENGKNTVKKLDSVTEALSYFKEQEGPAQLAVGKDAAHKTTVATLENGVTNFMEKDFQRNVYTPPVTQTFYLDKGKGFTATQAANLVQGRSVYRDDLMSLAGNAYKAWMKLDFDKPRDRFNNLNFNQYHDPSYGFKLKEVLEKYNIKELEDPTALKKLETSIKNGNQPLVTVNKEGEEIKLRVEASPRYNQVNFHTESGKIQKREALLKIPEVEKSISQKPAKEKVKEESMSMHR
jgi:hypothetical protein